MVGLKSFRLKYRAGWADGGKKTRSRKSRGGIAEGGRRKSRAGYAEGGRRKTRSRKSRGGIAE
jgi:hypothetical protein